MSYGAVAALEGLAEVRRRLDSLEVIHGDLLRFRTGIREVWKRAQAAVDDKWSERVATTSNSARPSFSRGEVEGPRERYARADQAVIAERIVARQRDKVMDAVNDAVTVVDQARRNLEGARMDLHAVLRVLAAPEHRLDRTDA